MDFIITSEEQAMAILNAYWECKICSDCILNTPEGWKCSYLAEQAKKYLKKMRG